MNFIDKDTLINRIARYHDYLNKNNYTIVLKQDTTRYPNGWYQVGWEDRKLFNIKLNNKEIYDRFWYLLNDVCDNLKIKFEERK